MSTWPQPGVPPAAPAGGWNNESRAARREVRPCRSDSSQQASSKAGAVHSVAALDACGESYEDPFGNSITKEEHERRVANNATHDALINLMAECQARPRSGCPIPQK